MASCVGGSAGGLVGAVRVVRANRDGRSKGPCPHAHARTCLPRASLDLRDGASDGACRPPSPLSTEDYQWDEAEQVVNVSFKYRKAGDTDCTKAPSEVLQRCNVVNAPTNTQWALCAPPPAPRPRLHPPRAPRGALSRARPSVP